MFLLVQLSFKLCVWFCFKKVFPLLYSYQMYMRATVSLSAPRQELLHEGVSPRATVLVEWTDKLTVARISHLITILLRR